MRVASSDELAGRVAVVTGASRGIGLETASVLAGAGASVVLADLPGAPLDEAAARVAEVGAADHHEVDISDESSVEALVAFTVERFGGLDILNNNAAMLGVSGDVDIANMSVVVWDRMFAVNARGTMLMCKHALRPMVEAGRGSIVNIDSGTAESGQPSMTAYGSSKGAIQTLTKYVATQTADRGVRCNCIAPGLVGTDTLRREMPRELIDAVVGSKLVQRLGEPRDISEAVLFLASDRSSFMTGQILHVDGGFYAHVPSLDAERRLMTSKEAP